MDINSVQGGAFLSSNLSCVYPGKTHEGQRGEIIAHLPGLVREPAAGKCALANFIQKEVEAWNSSL